MEMPLGQERGEAVVCSKWNSTWSQLWTEIQEEHLTSNDNNDVFKHPARRSSRGPNRGQIEHQKILINN